MGGLIVTINITGKQINRQDEILTSSALELIEKLHKELNNERLELLAKRQERIKAIARGEVPRWDSEAKKYVYGEEAEISLGGVKEETTVIDPQADEEPSEELPF